MSFDLGRLEYVCYIIAIRSTEPALASRALPSQSVITLVARLRIDRRSGHRGQQQIGRSASGSRA